MLKQHSKYFRGENISTSKYRPYELAQAKLRIGICAVIYAYIYYLYVNNHIDPLTALAIVGVHVTSATLILRSAMKDSFANKKRIIAGIVLDHVSPFLVMAAVGTYGAPIFFTFTFVTIGNGFRFGLRYLALSGFISSALIVLLFSSVKSWENNNTIISGFLLSHIMITLYTGFLLAKLDDAKNKLEQLAQHDILTGLPNRHAFHEYLTNILKQSQSEAKDVTCLYFDLDGFKKVNDTYGHGVGDTLLKFVSSAVQSTLNENYFFARLGGDEFTIISNSISLPEEAEKLAHKIIKTIEAIKEVDSCPVNVSASVGIALMTRIAVNTEHDEVHQSNQLVKAADEAMYIAKRKGKGRCELFQLEKNNIPQEETAKPHLKVA